MRILNLIACGETTWNQEGRLLGSADLPLSQPARSTAITEAEHLAAMIEARDGKSRSPISTIYHSPDEAAAETAQVFASALNTKVKPVDGLTDPHLGLLEGLTEQMIADRFPKRYKQWRKDPTTVSPPEGEELVDARARLFRTLARLLRKSKSRETAVVLHDLNLGFLRCWLAGAPTQQLWQMVRDRPLIERYVLADSLPSAMEEAAGAELTRM